MKQHLTFVSNCFLTPQLSSSRISSFYDLPYQALRLWSSITFLTTFRYSSVSKGFLNLYRKMRYLSNFTDDVKHWIFNKIKKERTTHQKMTFSQKVLNLRFSRKTRLCKYSVTYYIYKTKFKLKQYKIIINAIIFN